MRKKVLKKHFNQALILDSANCGQQAALKVSIILFLCICFFIKVLVLSLQEKQSPFFWFKKLVKNCFF